MSEISAAKAKDGEIVVEKKSGNGSKKHKQVTEPSLNMDELRDLANLVIEHGFTDFEFENENIRVRLSKMTGVQAAAATAPAVSATAPATAAVPVAVEAPVDEDAGLFNITSPIVGTFYRSSGPENSSLPSATGADSARTGLHDSPRPSLPP